MAIVGAPNVGKSTLFNRFLGRRRALVGHRPGITRDRVAAKAEVGGQPVMLMDTGGIHIDPAAGIELEVRLQAHVAIETAGVIVLVVDGREGRGATAEDLADLLRRSGQPVIVAVNKMDHPGVEHGVAEFYELGLGEPVAISAEHGLGIEALAERILEALPPPEVTPEEPDLLSLAIVGRPNVGKSSLLNALGSEERSIVAPEPGTTRDSVDLILRSGERRYRIVDTAGIRRGGRRVDGLEHLAVHRAVSSLRGADVALLVLDGAEGITAQDLSVAGEVRRSGRSLVIGANKWDLVARGPEPKADFRKLFERRFKFARYAPMIFLSARTGHGVGRILPTVEKVWENGGQWVSSSRLNRMLQDCNRRHTGRRRSGAPIRCFYITQTGVHPPSFTVFTNTSGPVHFSYRRFVENRLREEFDYRLTPIRLRWRRK